MLSITVRYVASCTVCAVAAWLGILADMEAPLSCRTHHGQGNLLWHMWTRFRALMPSCRLKQSWLLMVRRPISREADYEASFSNSTYLVMWHVLTLTSPITNSCTNLSYDHCTMDGLGWSDQWNKTCESIDGTREKFELTALLWPVNGWWMVWVSWVWKLKIDLKTFTFTCFLQPPPWLVSPSMLLSVACWLFSLA